MSKDFEPVGYASLAQDNIELRAELERSSAVTRSVVAENSGLLLAFGDAIELLLKFASDRGCSADQAEALPCVKVLRTAINIPVTEDILESIISERLLRHQNAPKADAPVPVPDFPQAIAV